LAKQSKPKPFSADALLFDLGGVVIEIDFNRAFAKWAEFAACEETLVRARFSPDEPYRRHEVGAIGVEDYFGSLRGSLGIDLTDAQFLQGWNAIFVGEVPGIADLLARAARKLPLYAFTNTNPTHERHWSQHFPDVMRHFRKIYVSSTIGLRKPDAAAFRFVANDMGVRPERIVFFDDAPANIAGARACGLQVIQVTSVADVAAALDALAL
jgi:putative hydrolase of the HAD superfamily